MNQQVGTGEQKYGQIPYATAQDPPLINDTRYTGQSGGTLPSGTDGRGPAQETRYGATPISTEPLQSGHGERKTLGQELGYGERKALGQEMGYGEQRRGVGQQPGYGDDMNRGVGSRQENPSVIDKIRDPAAYGFTQGTSSHPESGFRPPGVLGHQGGHGSQLTGSNAPASEAGYEQSRPGYGDMRSQQQGQQGPGLTGHNTYPSEAGYGQSQPGYGEVGGTNLQQGAQRAQLTGRNTYPSEAGYGQSQPGYGDMGSRQTTFQQGVQGSQLTGHNTYPLEAGYGQSQPGYARSGVTQDNRFNQRGTQELDNTDFGQNQPGYGESGFGARTEGENTRNLWPNPARPAGAVAAAGYGVAHESGLFGHGTTQQGGGMTGGHPNRNEYGSSNPSAGAAYDSNNPNRRIFDNPTEQQTQYGSNNPSTGATYGSKNPNQRTFDNPAEQQTQYGSNNPSTGATYGSNNFNQRTSDNLTEQQTQLGTGHTRLSDQQPQYGTDGVVRQAGGVEGYGATPGSGQTRNTTQGPYGDNIGQKESTTQGPYVPHSTLTGGLGDQNISQEGVESLSVNDTGYGGGVGGPRNTGTAPAFGNGYEKKPAVGADAYLAGTDEGVTKYDPTSGTKAGEGYMPTGIDTTAPTSGYGTTPYDDSNEYPKKESAMEKVKDRMCVGHHNDGTTGTGSTAYDETTPDDYTHADTGAHDTTTGAPHKKGLMAKIKEKLHG